MSRAAAADLPASASSPMAAGPQAPAGHDDDGGAWDDRGRATGRALRDRWLGWRNRLLTSPTFQRWAAAFPLTRPRAQREARALFDTISGFVQSQTLFACVELGLFDLVRRAPQSAAAIAEHSGLSRAAVDRLMPAAAALGLFDRDSANRYVLGPKGAALCANPGLESMIRHHGLLYRDLADPVGLLRAGRGRLAEFWGYAGRPAPDQSVDAANADGYSTLMAQTQRMVAQEVLAAYPVSKHRTLLDVGGGEGVFVAEAGRAAPNLALRVFDLPAVVDRAAQRLAEAGLGARATVTGGDFFCGPLPQGCDLISLVRVLHDHTDDDALRLLRNVYDALPPGGTLLIAEPMAETPGAETVGPYFAFYLLSMGRGRPRSVGEIMAMADAAGFRQLRRRPTRTPLITQAITARKPLLDGKDQKAV